MWRLELRSILVLEFDLATHETAGFCSLWKSHLPRWAQLFRALPGLWRLFFGCPVAVRFEAPIDNRRPGCHPAPHLADLAHLVDFGTAGYGWLQSRRIGEVGGHSRSWLRSMCGGCRITAPWIDLCLLRGGCTAVFRPIEIFLKCQTQGGLFSHWTSFSTVGARDRCI
jgi:hypothetical protein